MSNRYLGGYITDTYNPLGTNTVSVDVLVVAGGGSGGYGNGTVTGGGGGGGGAREILGLSLARNATYTVTIGGGGAGRTSAGQGNTGSDSVFGSVTANDYVFSSTLEHRKNIPFSNVVLQGSWYSNVAFNYSLYYPKCIGSIGSLWYFYVDLTDQIISENLNSFNLIVKKSSGSDVVTKVSIYNLTTTGSLFLVEESEATITNSSNLQTITYPFSSSSPSTTTKGYYAKVECTSGTDPVDIYNMYILFENTSMKKTLFLS